MRSIEELKIDKDIGIAKTLPGFFYTSDSIFNEIIQLIFEDSWQLIAHENKFEKTINPFIFLKDSLNEPLIYINSDERIVVSNVCTHRANILITCPSDRVLKCKYHGRQFNLDGTFKSAPGFSENINFPSNSDNLNIIKSTIWKSLIFCTLSNSSKITGSLEKIDDIMSFYPFEKLNFFNTSSYEIGANWLLYCDNYLEGFHVPFVHSGLSRDIDLKSYSIDLYDNFVLQSACTKNKLLSFNDSLPGNDGQYPYAYYFFLFPNTMINFYPWGISVNVIEPISLTKTRIKYITLLLDGQNKPIDADSCVDKVELEDQEIVLKSQLGVGSRFCKRGRYSKLHESGLHHFHRFLLIKLKNKG